MQWYWWFFAEVVMLYWNVFQKGSKISLLLEFSPLLEKQLTHYAWPHLSLQSSLCTFLTIFMDIWMPHKPNPRSPQLWRPAAAHRPIPPQSYPVPYLDCLKISPYRQYPRIFRNLMPGRCPGALCPSCMRWMTCRHWDIWWGRWGMCGKDRVSS